MNVTLYNSTMLTKSKLAIINPIATLFDFIFLMYLFYINKHLADKIGIGVFVIFFVLSIFDLFFPFLMAFALIGALIRVKDPSSRGGYVFLFRYLTIHAAAGIFFVQGIKTLIK